ncbi:MAG: aminotransferase class V-fold PLP-dependent enzyme [Rhodobacteraceae bacterium]|nr:aminotransferase class V-fold PLP-dependent enzyme [Paracoccaceae bacterium]
MHTGPAHLFVPGPTNLPDEVRRAMVAPMPDHRAPEFAAFLRPLLADLAPVFGTSRARIALIPGSGTSAWEAAITNTLSPGDRVLMARHGMFSALWAEMAERLGLVVECIDVAWGAPCPAREFGRRLGADRHGEIKAVFVTHNETATGVTSDVAAVRRELDAAFHDALLFVDGVSSIGSMPFEMDAWGVDLAVTGSQKGLMAPAGLGILALSPKAIGALDTARSPRSFFDVRAILAAHEAGSFPHTPPATVLHALRAALDRLAAETLPAVFARHRRLAEGVRAAVAAWGLSTVAEHPSFASQTVTAIRTPEGVDAREVIATARTRYHTFLGAGLGPLSGRAFRIGHLGDLNEGAVLAALAVSELALAEAGARIAFGSGVAAAQEHFAGAAAPCLAAAA